MRFGKPLFMIRPSNRHIMSVGRMYGGLSYNNQKDYGALFSK